IMELLLDGCLRKSQLQDQHCLTYLLFPDNSNQRFIYDNITGGLYFDQDGSAGAFTQVKFAQLSAGLSLTKNNFVVVV
ncbi:hypothetical protein, partial [Nostoc sp.]|uniref:hypothetical protein n=1 Tax=Nostoc sp. TaxID=1180 RepID=UPI002FF78B74